MCGDVLRNQEEGAVPSAEATSYKDKKGEMAASEEIGLKRELGLFSAVSLIISVMIGKYQHFLCTVNYKLSL